MILVVGEALIDLFVDLRGGVVAIPGGGPYNAARTVARLGRPATLVGRLSNDRFGVLLRSRALLDGVTLAFPDVDLPTTLAVVDSDPSGVNRYQFHAAGTAAFDVTTADVDGLGLAGSAVAGVHVGTLGLVYPPMAAAAERLVETVPAGAVVLLDPNCRPSAIADGAAYRQRLDRMLRRVDVVKVSVEDLAYLFPGERPERAAGLLHERGVSCVLVTDGGSRAYAVIDAGTVTVGVPEVEVVDTVGAGDAFGGSWLAWWTGQGLGRAELARAEPVEEAMRAAVAVASLTCSRAGAEPPTAAEARSAPGWAWLPGP